MIAGEGMDSNLDKHSSTVARKNVRHTFFMSFGFLFTTTAIIAFALVFGVQYIKGDSPYYAPVDVFAGYKGYNVREIIEYPFPYLLSISFFFALSGAYWITIIAPRKRRYHGIQALVVPWIAVFLTSPVWGLIWSMYRWPPSYFSDASWMMHYYWHDVRSAILLCLPSAIFSFPMNLLSYVAVLLLLLICKRLIQQKGLIG
jgi:hypothetical protein